MALQLLLKVLHILVLLKPTLLERLDRRRTFNRTKVAQESVHQAGGEKTHEEVDSVHLDCANRNLVFARRCANKTNNVGQDSANVRHERSPVQTDLVVHVIRADASVLWSKERVQVGELQVASSHVVVVATNDTHNGRKEDRIGRQVGGEFGGARQQVPRLDNQGQKSTEVRASSDVHVLRQERRDIGTERQGVGTDVGSQLRNGKGKAEEKHAGTAAAGVVVQEAAQDIQGRPQGLAVKHSGSGTHQNADQRRDGETERDGNGLHNVLHGEGGFIGKTRKVRGVGDQRRKVGQGVHGGLDENPRKLGAVDLGLFVDHRARPVTLDQCPHQESHACHWSHVRLEREQVSDLVGREPQEGQGEQPEEEKRQELERGEVLVVDAVGHGVLQVLAEDGPQHEPDTRPGSHGLDRVPDARHHHTVENGPDGKENAKRRSHRDGERNVVDHTNSGGNRHKDSTQGVSEPHRKPRLPPRHAVLHSGGRNHPRVDVERVGNPEKHIVVPRPLSSRRLDGPQVIVEQVPLSCGQVVGLAHFEGLEKPSPLAFFAF